MRAKHAGFRMDFAASAKMRLFSLLALSCTLGAQTLEISSSSASRGEAGTFLIRYRSGAAKSPTALQWEFSAPASISIVVNEIVAGSVTEAAGKSLTCAKRQDGANPHYACVVFGGKKPIADGPVAIVKYMVSKRSPPGKAAVKATRALASSDGQDKIPVADATGEIAIR